MTLKIGSSQSSNNQSVSNPAEKIEKEKLSSNSAAENEAAIDYLANKNPAPPVNLSNTDGDGKITASDFLRKVKSEQPFDGETLSKKQVRVFIDVKKSASQTTVADYDKATWRAIFRQAGYGMLTDEEIETAVGAMNAVGWTTKDSGFDLASLRAEDAKPGAMVVKTNQSVIERAKRAGQAVLQYQEYKSQEADLAVEKGKIYVNQAIGGFLQPIVNAPVNIVNGISEPLRAGEKLAFGTNYIPEIPKMSVAEQSEYWNKDNRLYANKGAEIVSTITFGGALGSRALATQTGRVLTGVESGYNIAAGLTGKDVTQTDAQGNARQMEWLERGTRLAGGLFGARQTVKSEISAANSAVNKLDDIFKNPPKSQMEMVTPEGFRVRIENGIDKLDDLEKGGNTFEIRTKRTQSGVAPDEQVINVLKIEFEPVDYKFRSHTIKLSRTGMKHILQRHHPEFWNGSVKDKQSYFDAKISINELQNAITAVLKQNRELLITKGSNIKLQIKGDYNGNQYVLGLKRGQIHQLYIPK